MEDKLVPARFRKAMGPPASFFNTLRRRLFAVRYDLTRPPGLSAFLSRCPVLPYSPALCKNKRKRSTERGKPCPESLTWKMKLRKRGSTEMLTLNDDEKKWLDQYRSQLHRLYPGLIQDLVVFGSKARGDPRQDSDLDLMVIIRDGNKAIKKDIAFLAYDLAAGTEAVPSILVYTEAEKDQRLQQEISFMDSVQREGISVR